MLIRHVHQQPGMTKKGSVSLISPVVPEMNHNGVFGSSSYQRQRYIMVAISLRKPWGRVRYVLYQHFIIHVYSMYIRRLMSDIIAIFAFIQMSVIKKKTDITLFRNIVHLQIQVPDWESWKNVFIKTRNSITV